MHNGDTALDEKRDSKDTATILLQCTLDYAASLMERDKFSFAFEELWKHLTDLLESAALTGCSADFRSLARSHKLFRYCQEDPFTRRALEKPRGYAGDAQMLDFIYSGAAPAETSRFGMKIFVETTRGSVGLPVLLQKHVMSAYIIDAIRSRKKPRILSLGAGHCRELEGSYIRSILRPAEFIALDQDPECCEELRRIYKRKITTFNEPVEKIAARQLEIGRFDLIYAAGLYEYLSDRTARALTDALKEMLLPNGRLVISNAAKSSTGRGYMDLFMDWRLNYRTQAGMEALLGGNSNCNCFSDPHNNIEYAVFDRARQPSVGF
jgi:hypothetical protein